MNYVQGLESFHKRAIEENASLLRRLNVLLDEVWDGCLEGFIAEKDSFINKVLKARNYLIHSNKGSADPEIIYVAERLKIILITHLLLKLGIPRENVYKSIKEFRQFEYLKCKKDITLKGIF